MSAQIPSVDAPPGAAAAPGVALGAEAAAPIGFPIAVMGASARGLGAFKAFFSSMPTSVDLNLAFVLAQHLAPERKSLPTQWLRRCTGMRVSEAQYGMAVQPNCVFVLPPNRDMAFRRSRLRLPEPGAPRGQRSPIDLFFNPLAQDQHERAIVVRTAGAASP